MKRIIVITFCTWCMLDAAGGTIPLWAQDYQPPLSRPEVEMTEESREGKTAEKSPDYTVKVDNLDFIALEKDSPEFEQVEDLISPSEKRFESLKNKGSAYNKPKVMNSVASAPSTKRTLKSGGSASHAKLGSDFKKSVSSDSLGNEESDPNIMLSGPIDYKQETLHMPILRKCMYSKHNRITYIDTGHGEFSFVRSWDFSDKEWKPQSWLEARNTCRRRCMELVSIDSEHEARLLENEIKKSNTNYMWTSGLRCTSKTCLDYKDVTPYINNGWFWTGNGKRIPTTGWTRQFWSHTGDDKRPQPDDAESKREPPAEENCLAVLNNVYGDGVKWHDIACYHPKPFMCQISKPLRDYIESKYNTELY